MTGTLPKLTESDVIAQSLAFLAIHGCHLERQNTGGMTNARGRYVQFNEPGSSDYRGSVAGRRLAVEFKAPDWKPGGKRERTRFARQIAYLNRVNADGGVGLLIDHLDALVVAWHYVAAGASVFVRDDGRMEITPKGGTDGRDSRLSAIDPQSEDRTRAETSEPDRA